MKPLTPTQTLKLTLTATLSLLTATLIAQLNQQYSGLLFLTIIPIFLTLTKITIKEEKQK